MTIAAVAMAMMLMGAGCQDNYENLPTRTSSTGSGPGSACYTSHGGYTPERQQGFVQWTPDGTALIFDHDAYSYDAEQNIWSIQEDGSNLHRVGKTTLPPFRDNGSDYGFHGDLSPDGKYLVHSTCIFERDWRDGRKIGPPELVISRMDGSPPVRLTHSNEFKNYPAWSPDGTRIAYVGNWMELWATPHDPLTIWILKVDPEASPDSNLPFRTPLNDERKNLMEVTPEWSPDGEHGDDDELHLAFLKRPESAVSEHAPVWSPDSRYLAYMARENDRWAAHVTEIDQYTAIGTAKTELKYQKDELYWSTFNIARPTWAPDSSKLAFVSNSTEGESTIHVTKPDGTPLKELKGPPSRISHMAWHPDGSEILIAANGLWKMYTSDWTLEQMVHSDWIQPADKSSRSLMTGIAWSPDGSRIAARLGPIRTAGARFWLITMDRDGENPRLVATRDGVVPYYFKACGLETTLQEAFESIGVRPVCQ